MAGFASESLAGFAPESVAGFGSESWQGLRRNTQEGIRIRKEKGLYSGRRVGTGDTIDRLLSKEKNKKIIEYLKKGTYSYAEIGKIVGCSTTTITKVNKAYNTKTALA